MRNAPPNGGGATKLVLGWTNWPYCLIVGESSTPQEDNILVQHEICLVSNFWIFCLRANIAQFFYIVNIFILYSQFPVLPRITSSDSHPRRRSHEDQGFQCRTHMQDYRKCSGDGSFKEPLESTGRSHSKMQAFSESSEQQLCFRTKRSVSLVRNTVTEYLNHFRKGNPKDSPSQVRGGQPNFCLHSLGMRSLKNGTQF